MQEIMKIFKKIATSQGVLYTEKLPIFQKKIYIACSRFR